MTQKVPSEDDDEPSTSWVDAVKVAADSELAVSLPFTDSAQPLMDVEPSSSVKTDQLAATEEDPGERPLDMLDVLISLPRLRKPNRAVCRPNPLPTLPMTFGTMIVISYGVVIRAKGQTNTLRPLISVGGAVTVPVA